MKNISGTRHSYTIPIQIWQSVLLVGMLRSSTQLVKSHGDYLCLEYLWNWNEYGSLENRLNAMEKNAEYGGQPETLA